MPCLKVSPRSPGKHLLSLPLLSKEHIPGGFGKYSIPDQTPVPSVLFATDADPQARLLPAQDQRDDSVSHPGCIPHWLDPAYCCLPLAVINFTEDCRHAVRPFQSEHMSFLKAFGPVLLPLNFSLLQDWQLQKSPVLWGSPWTSSTAFTSSSSVPWAFPIFSVKPSATLSLFHCDQEFLLLILHWTLCSRFLMRKNRSESKAVEVGAIRAPSTLLVSVQ